MARQALRSLGYIGLSPNNRGMARDKRGMDELGRHLRYDRKLWLGRILKPGRRIVREVKGETEVGLLLAGLGEDHCVENEIRSPYGNLGHILLGKHSGPILIETKSHGRRAVADGHGLAAHIRESRENMTAQLSDSTL